MLSLLGILPLPVLLVCGACGRSNVPTPPYVQQKTSALSEVPYAPPPARVEGIPRRPREGAVWIDGEWIWDGSRWSWKQGRWLVPPKGARFAPWTAVRAEDGTLFFASGVWFDAKGQILADPPALVGARVGTTPVVSADGEPLPTGPNILAIEDAGH